MSEMYSTQQTHSAVFSFEQTWGIYQLKDILNPSYFFEFPYFMAAISKFIFSSNTKEKDTVTQNTQTCECL